MFWHRRYKESRAESIIYECYRGRFHPEIGRRGMSPYTFSPIEPEDFLSFDADFFQMAEDTFRALLKDCSVQLELSTGTGAPEKVGAGPRLDREFPAVYALFLESHGLYPGKFRLSEEEGRQKLTLYFPPGDPRPLAAYFSLLRRWPDLGAALWMECGGVLKEDAEEGDFEKPDLHLFCSDCHPAMTIERSEAVGEDRLIRRLRQVCWEHRKEFLCDCEA